MCLKVYKTPKQSTLVCITHRLDFTTLERYHGGYCFILCRENCEVNSRNTAFDELAPLKRMRGMRFRLV